MKEPRYKVGDKVLVCIDPRKVYRLQVTETHLKYNNLKRDIRLVDHSDNTYAIGGSIVWFSEDMLQPVDDTSYGQVSYVKDTIDITDDQLERNILNYAKEIDKILFPEEPDKYSIFWDKDVKAYIVNSGYRATINLFSRFGLHPIRNLDKYIRDIVGYDPIELPGKVCGGVKSLIDLNRLWRRFYIDVHTKYNNTSTPIIFDPDKFTSSKETDKDFKIEIIKLPTIGSLNFIY